MTFTHLLLCPVCSLPLSQTNNILTCTHGHSFDLAHEGYVNLLRKKLPGDTKEMLIARRQFLEQGHYLLLSDTLNEQIHAYGLSRAKSTLTLLDAGCGEGYYLGRLVASLAAQQPELETSSIGIDISKEAMRLAARRYPGSSFVVANVKDRLTFADDTFDVLLNIFAPRNVEEFARVIKPGGLLVVVIPGPAHLLQLREQLQLLTIEEQKEQKLLEQLEGRFVPLTTLTLRYTLHLRGAEIAQAVMMTPNYWHLSEDRRQHIADTSELRTEIEFLCTLWQRKEG